MPWPELACIPYRDAFWYAVRVTIQIAVRLPDAMVHFLDRTVASGKAPSRAAVVTAALEREMRRDAAHRDVEILESVGPRDDLDELVAWSVSHGELGD